MPLAQLPYIHTDDRRTLGSPEGLLMMTVIKTGVAANKATKYSPRWTAPEASNTLSTHVDSLSPFSEVRVCSKNLVHSVAIATRKVAAEAQNITLPAMCVAARTKPPRKVPPQMEKSVASRNGLNIVCFDCVEETLRQIHYNISIRWGQDVRWLTRFNMPPMTTEQDPPRIQG